jgi:hypothetical protein
MADSLRQPRSTTSGPSTRPNSATRARRSPSAVKTTGYSAPRSASSGCRSSVGGAAGLVFMVQAIVGALVVVGASVVAFWQPTWLLVTLVPALTAVPWGRRAPLMLLLNYSSAVLAPLIGLHVVSILPFRLVEALVELLSGGDPAGVWRPTLRPASERPQS